MTRVEKYRRYREEISNMKFEKVSEISEASKQVKKLCGNRANEKLDFESVMVVHEVFEKDQLTQKNKRLINLTKYEISYYLVAIIFVVIVIAAMVIISI